MSSGLLRTSTSSKMKTKVEYLQTTTQTHDKTAQIIISTSGIKILIKVDSTSEWHQVSNYQIHIDINWYIAPSSSCCVDFVLKIASGVVCKLQKIIILDLSDASNAHWVKPSSFQTFLINISLGGASLTKEFSTTGLYSLILEAQLDEPPFVLKLFEYQYQILLWLIDKF